MFYLLPTVLKVSCLLENLTLSNEGIKGFVQQDWNSSSVVRAPYARLALELFSFVFRGILNIIITECYLYNMATSFSSVVFI